jgi:hypothetical protein
MSNKFHTIAELGCFENELHIVTKHDRDLVALGQLQRAINESSISAKL